VFQVGQGCLVRHHDACRDCVRGREDFDGWTDGWMEEGKTCGKPFEADC
jgi:hypothetical protein